MISDDTDCIFRQSVKAKSFVNAVCREANMRSRFLNTKGLQECMKIFLENEGIGIFVSGLQDLYAVI